MAESGYSILFGTLAAVVGQTGVGIALTIKRKISNSHQQMSFSITSSSSSSSSPSWKDPITKRFKDWKFWLASVMLLAGETCNFIGYFFMPAYVMVMLGAINVLVSQLCSAIVLREYVSSVQILGLFSIIVGVIVVLVSTPHGHSDDQVISFYDASVRWMDPVPLVMVVSSATIIVALAVVAVKNLIKLRGSNFRNFPLEEAQVNLLLIIYSLSGAISVIITKGVGILLYEAIAHNQTNFHNALAYLIWPCWIVFIVGQLVLVNWLLSHKELSIMGPLMYAFYTLSASISSSIYYREMGAHSFTQLLLTYCGAAFLFAGVWFTTRSYPRSMGFWPLCCPVFAHSIVRKHVEIAPFEHNIAESTDADDDDDEDSSSSISSLSSSGSNFSISDRGND